MKYLGAAIAAFVLGSLVVVPAQSADLPVEPYSAYRPQTRCTPKAKPGARRLLRWLVVRHGGASGRIGSSCRGHGISEHKEGRALDWSLDVRKARDRARAERVLAELFDTSVAGETDALARRMGVMYVIWNDRIYASYDGFTARTYHPPGCRRLVKCSATARHRDHMHISLNRAGGRARTSFYRTR